MFRQIIKPGININFIGHRRTAFAISSIIILICLGSIAFKGLVLGIDFAGGLLVQAKFTQATSPEDIRQAIVGAKLPNPSIQAFGDEGENEFLINLQIDDILAPKATPGAIEGTQGATVSKSVSEALVSKFGAEQVEIRREEMVGAKVGDDLREKALSALYYSILMVLIYISGRFEQKWGTSFVMVVALLLAVYLAQLIEVDTVYRIVLAVLVTIVLCYFLKFKYALGAILALLHDVIITVGVFSLLDKEITLSFVAAILTIAGYSLNDTIIIYDRIRERTFGARNDDYPMTINRSINETLSRTVLTSGSTLLVVFSLYFLGGEVNRDFALALLIGISVGTLSSIFISASVLLFWSQDDQRVSHQSLVAVDAKG